MDDKDDIYNSIFKWAYKTGKILVEKNDDLLRRLIFELRGEETPGRFLERLSEVLTEYRTNRSINANVSILPVLMERRWHADQFHYMKSAILTGFLNSLSSR